MTTAVSLSTSLGEVMAPGILVMPLLLAPDGKVTVEPGALHGRSGIETQLERAASRDALKRVQRYWFIWVAVELDAKSNPVRYKGLSASEFFVDPLTKHSYKALAEQVNRISEAIGGHANLKTIEPAGKSAIREELVRLSRSVWDAATPTVKDALI